MFASMKFGGGLRILQQRVLRLPSWPDTTLGDICALVSGQPAVGPDPGKVKKTLSPFIVSLMKKDLPVFAAWIPSGFFKGQVR